MKRRVALFCSVMLYVVLTSRTALAQQSESAATGSKAPQQSSSARQSAMSLVEEALAGTGSLTVPSNRLAIELRAFPIVWSRSDARARALIQQMASDFAQEANPTDPDQDPVYVRNNLRNQRNTITQGIAASDPELALLFVKATSSCLKSGDANDDSADNDLVIDLAAQIALHDPHRALQLAKQQLKETDDLPQSMINLLDTVQRNNPEAGASLFGDILNHLRRQNLAEDTAALSFAASLLASQFSRQSENGKPEAALRTLADSIATAALSSRIMETQSYVLSDAMDALNALVPSKVQLLHGLDDREEDTNSNSLSFWQKFSQARSSGDLTQAMTLLAKAPEEVRPNASAQIAQDFASKGDLEHTRQLAENLAPWVRGNLMQDAIRSAALAAGSRADFSSAHQLASQITDEDSRATLLSDLAIFANGMGKPRVAEEMLGEATSLMINHAPGTSAFAAQLRVAEAYLRVKPVQAIPLLERSASQIQQALAAAAQLDGFLPDGRSFEGSELILSQGFLYASLVEPYALATAELASFDLATARSLADRLPLPEARLMAEVFVAAGALGQKDQTQTASNPSLGIRLWPDDRY